MAESVRVAIMRHETESETEMSTFGKATEGSSKWFKLADLEERTGMTWGAGAAIETTIVEAWEETYPDGDPAYAIRMAGIQKPLGCNLTNRRTLQEMYHIPDEAQWSTETLTGKRIRLFGTMHSNGKPGIVIGACRDTVQQATEQAHAEIDRAQKAHGVAPQEPAGFVDPEDPGAF